MIGTIALRLVAATALGVSFVTDARAQAPDAAQRTRGDWHGTLEWTAGMDAPFGSQYRLSGLMKLTLRDDGRGNLTGTVEGTQKERWPGTGPYDACAVDTVADGRLTGTLVGSYSQGRGTFAHANSRLRIEPFRDTKFTPPRLTLCSGIATRPWESVHTYFPDEFRRLLHDLEPAGDGGFQSNVSGRMGGPVFYWINAKLKLMPGDCPPPHPDVTSGLYTRDPFDDATPGDIAPNCTQCRGAAWQPVRAEATWITNPNWKPAGPEGPKPTGIIAGILWQLEWLANIGVTVDTTTCVNIYRATWRCPTSGEIRQTRKTKIVDGVCVPRG